MSLTFDPRTQTFYILGLPNSTNTTPPLIPISMPAIDAQRIRLANTSINYGVQLGLCLFSLLTTLLLLPTNKLRRPIHLTQTFCLVIAITRLALLVLYFPGPLTEYYVAWTQDASILRPDEYNITTASSALRVVQAALVEAALALQSRVLVQTWGSRCSPGSSTTAGNGGRRQIGKCWWRLPVLLFAVTLAVAAVSMRAIWVVRHTQALKGHVLPLPVDSVGAAAVVLAAVSVFYFCGVFFAHLALHLVATRRILRGQGAGGRKFSITLTLRGVGRGKNGGWRRGLTSLEILAVGNGVLMLAPCLFAGLDVAAGPLNTHVLPFDAGSWVGTIVAAGLPLISVAAFYRGSDSGNSRMRRSHGEGWSHRRGRESRHHTSSFFASNDTTLPFPPSSHSHFQNYSKTDEDTTTVNSSSRYWRSRSPANDDLDDLEMGNGGVESENPEGNGASRENYVKDEENKRIHARRDYQATIESENSTEG
ncbi:fungal pheromone mating factor STE2 GPCR-domain-containing protein [Annulohypoxylon maeteangense]|uniref:fungal pheromone mating factor STE2 GPCR-domain-containing protein n=1 Tax=Annulohypoxylon maeteangense TaxID=1927788 RepID=UPI002008922E|nr:fungal pheromone mating factor STE2 GPCR-domain-containing protein [Annulohypoxylon maeteangense]KAI0880696.1 fungal pheromone mating factor STE2 GPCR-domain-containing protein [Annulohypoxylon maeteangense]